MSIFMHAFTVLIIRRAGMNNRHLTCAKVKVMNANNTTPLGNQHKRGRYALFIRDPSNLVYKQVCVHVALPGWTPRIRARS